MVDGDLRHDLGYEAADGVFQPLVVCERRRARRQQRPDGFDGTFDAAECCKDADALRRRIREIENNKDATAVEQDLMTTLEVCYEFCLRGFHFEPIDIYRSDATKFVVTENGLLPPFTSVRGLGETAALDTVEKRKGKDFTSVEEFSLCCNKLSQTHIDQLRALGAFAGLPETSQLTLF